MPTRAQEVSEAEEEEEAEEAPAQTLALARALIPQHPLPGTSSSEVVLPISRLADALRVPLSVGGDKALVRASIVQVEDLGEPPYVQVRGTLDNIEEPSEGP